MNCMSNRKYSKEFKLETLALAKGACYKRSILMKFILG